MKVLQQLPDEVTDEGSRVLRGVEREGFETGNRSNLARRARGCRVALDQTGRIRVELGERHARQLSVDFQLASAIQTRMMGKW